MFQHCGVCSHETNKERFLFCWHIFPWQDKIVTCRKFGTCWHKTKFDLVCKTTLACCIPTVKVVLLTTINDWYWRLVWSMACAWCEQHEPRRVRCASRVVRKICNCIVDKIFCEVIAGPISSGCSDVGVVAHYFRTELICFCIEKSVEAIKATSKWPTIEWSCWSCFGQRGDVPFPHHVVAVSMRAQHFSKCACFFCNFSAIAGVATVEVCKTTDPNRVMIAPGVNRGASCGTHGCGVKT